MPEIVWESVFNEDSMIKGFNDIKNSMRELINFSQKTGTSIDDMFKHSQSGMFAKDIDEMKVNIERVSKMFNVLISAWGVTGDAAEEARGRMTSFLTEVAQSGEGASEKMKELSDVFERILQEASNASSSSLADFGGASQETDELLAKFTTLQRTVETLEEQLKELYGKISSGDMSDEEAADALNETLAVVEALKLKNEEAASVASQSIKSVTEDLSSLEEELTQVEGEIEKSAETGENIDALAQRYFELTSEIEIAKTMAGDLNESVEEFKGGGEKFSKLSESLGKIADEGKEAKAVLENSGAETAANAFGQLSLKFDDVLMKYKEIINDSQSTSSALQGLAGQLTALAGISISLSGAKSFVDEVVDIRSYFQDIESSMQVFLGSAEKGAEFTQKLKDYAYYNMFEFSDLAQASQQMIAYGHEVDSIIPRIDQLSNVAVGTHGSLMELVDAYNRAKSTGVVDARGIQSWAVKGVMIKDTLKEMGETAVGTQVTFDQLNKVLDKVTGEGGMFHELQLNMMSNISAEIGQFQDNYDAMLNEIGQNYQDTITDTIRFGSMLVDNYQTIGKALVSLVGSYGVYKAALIATRAAEKSNLTREVQNEIDKNIELAKSKGALYDADLKEAVAAGQLTEARAKTIESKRHELEALVANKTLKADEAKMIDDKNIYLGKLETELEKQGLINDAKQKEVDLTEKLKDASSDDGGGGDASSIMEEAAANAVNTASEEAKTMAKEANTVAEEVNTVAQDANTVRTNANTVASNANTVSSEANTVAERTSTVSKEANTVATKTNTIAEKTNTVSTNASSTALTAHNVAMRIGTQLTRIGTAAMGQFTGAVNGLKMAIMTNPLGILLGAITMALPWIMELINGTDEETEKTKEYGDEAERASAKVDELAKVINSTSDESKVHSDAVEQLTKMYDEYGVQIEKTKNEQGEEVASTNALITQKQKLIEVIRLEAIERQKANDIAANGKEYETKEEELQRDVKGKFSDQFNNAERDQLSKLIDEDDIGAVKEAYESYLDIIDAMKRGEATAADYQQAFNRYKDAVEETTKQVDVFTSSTKADGEAKREAKEIIIEQIAELVKYKVEQEKANDEAEKAAEAAKKAKLGNEAYAASISDSKKSVEKLKDELKKMVEEYGYTTLNVDIIFNQKNVPSWMKGFSETAAKKNMIYHKNKGDKLQKEGNIEEAKKEFEVAAQYGTQATLQQERRERQERRKGYDDRLKNAKNNNEVKSLLSDVDKDLSATDWSSSDYKYLQGVRKKAEALRKQHDGKEDKGAAKAEKERGAKELQEQWKHEEEMQKVRRDAARASEDASIAMIQNQGRRERAAREVQHKRAIEDLKAQEGEIYKKIYQDRKTANDTANKGKKNAVPYELTDEGSEGYLTDEAREKMLASFLQEGHKEELEYYKERMSQIQSNISISNSQRLREEIESERQLIASHQSYTDKKLAVDKKYQEDVEEINKAIKNARERGDEEGVNALLRTLEQAGKDRLESLSDIAKEELQDSPLFSLAWKDIESVSSETLNVLISKFKEFESSFSEDPEAMREWTDKIKSMTDEVVSRNPIQALILSRNELKKSYEERELLLAQTTELNGQKGLLEEKKAQLEEEIRLMEVQISVRKVMGADTSKEEQQLSNAREMLRSTTSSLNATNERLKTTYDKLGRTEQDISEKEERRRTAIEKIQGVVTRFSSSISQLGDTIGGTDGELLKLIGDTMDFAVTLSDGLEQIREINKAAGNAVNGIGEAVNGVSNGIKATAATASTAISTLEKASVILAIVSAAIQLLQQISSIIKDSHGQYEEYAKEVGEINKLKNAVSEYRLEVMKARLEQEKWFSSTGLADLTDQWLLSGQALNNYDELLMQAQAIYEDETGSGWLTNLGAQASRTIGDIVGGANKLVGLGGTIIDTATQELAKFAWANIAGGQIGMNMYLDDRLSKKYMDRAYQEGMTAAMNNLRIETRSASKGFLGSGIGGHSQRTEDLREWVRKNMTDEYGNAAELFDEKGMIDTRLTQKILDKYGDKLVGETKETLERLKELKEQYDEYQKQLQEYISGLYSPLSDNLVDALYDWYEDGTDVMDNFKEYAVNTFDSIGKEMMKSLVNELIFDKYKEQLKELYTAYSTNRANGMDAETALQQLSDGVMKSTDDFLKKTEEEIPVLQSAVSHLQEGLKERGLESSSIEDKRATYNIADKVTYDQMDEFTGILRAMQIAVEHGSVTRDLILANMETLASLMASNGTWGEIRNLVATSNDYLLDIKKSNREILTQFGEKMDDMIRKLDDLD